jgi:hypothetical protein
MHWHTNAGLQIIFETPDVANTTAKIDNCWQFPALKKRARASLGISSPCPVAFLTEPFNQGGKRQ